MVFGEGIDLLSSGQRSRLCFVLGVLNTY